MYAVKRKLQNIIYIIYIELAILTCNILVANEYDLFIIKYDLFII